MSGDRARTVMSAIEAAGARHDAGGRRNGFEVLRTSVVPPTLTGRRLVSVARGTERGRGGVLPSRYRLVLDRSNRGPESP